MTQPVSQLDVTTYNDSRICGDLAMCVSPVPLRKSRNQNKLRIACKFRAEQYCVPPSRGIDAVDAPGHLLVAVVRDHPATPPHPGVVPDLAPVGTPPGGSSGLSN